jgi:endonuclease/exonuclease/phosphatase family metal-dependent hydrolase
MIVPRAVRLPGSRIVTRYFLAFWNLENLFAPEDFPTREPWIAERVGAELEGWTAALFARKIAQLAAIIAGMDAGRGPDLLGVCEVENRFCLDALAAALDAALPARRYGLVHADATRDHRGIDTAFVYDTARLEVDPQAIFSHFVMRRTGTRDITQATFRTAAGAELVAMCNHWPSRSGGPSIESQGFRMTAGETLAYWHERVREVKGEDVALIAFGDFNDEPADPSLTLHARATRERDDVERAESARLYNLAWTYLRQQATTRQGGTRLLYGTLYWDGNGNVFDQILVSRALLTGASPLSVREETATIIAPAVMVDHRKSFGPLRFGLPKGDAAANVDQDGFSDHFPVAVVLEETTDGPSG